MARREQAARGAAPRVAILATGDELARGRSSDTNYARIASLLTDAGLEVRGGRLVGDDAGDIAGAVEEAARGADAVVVTGGLGPTPDDRTREAAARLAGTVLEEHRPSRRRIEALWRARGLPAPAGSFRQALVPRGARVLPNPAGTAPGFRFHYRGRVVFCLPGVPREMDAMLRRSVLPALRRLGDGPAPVRSLWVSCFGLSESALVERLGPLAEGGGEVSVGTRVEEGVITVSIHGTGEGARRAAGVRREVVRRLGDHAYAPDRVPLGEATADLLLRRGLTAATAESCTAGLVAKRLTDLPGASGAFLGGVVAYADRVKERTLGIPRALLRRHGAVCGEVAEAMARGVRGAVGADLAVAVTGIAGPGGGSARKPVGLVWFAVDSRRGTWAVERRFPGDRLLVRGLAANTALDLLRREAL